MIKTKSDMALLCTKHLNDFSLLELRLLVFNYIYHIKNIQVPEVFKVRITNNGNFMAECYRIHRYYQQFL